MFLFSNLFSKKFHFLCPFYNITLSIYHELFLILEDKMDRFGLISFSFFFHFSIFKNANQGLNYLSWFFIQKSKINNHQYNSWKSLCLNLKISDKQLLGVYIFRNKKTKTNKCFIFFSNSVFKNWKKTNNRSGVIFYMLNQN
jgi:hypothetical protein